jgi:sirohydrochlorin ferrochelatase
MPRPVPFDPVTLVLVGHGSRDPRSATALHRLADRVRLARPDLDVHLCFLELSVPSLDAVLDGLHGRVVVVPLLLAEAYHARIDLPQRVQAAVAGNRAVRVTVTRTLGARPELTEAVLDRALAGDFDGWVLAATGSSHERANVALGRLATRLAVRLGVPVRAAFVTTAVPDIASAAATLRAAGSAAPGLLPWFLAPGRLLDRAADQADAAGVSGVAEPLADHRLTARAVLARFDDALTADRCRPASGAHVAPSGGYGSVAISAPAPHPLSAQRSTGSPMQHLGAAE